MARVELVCALLGLLSSAHACQNRLEMLVHESHGAAPDLSTDVRGQCNSEIGRFTTTHVAEYKKIINRILKISLQYIPIASHFGRDTVERPGFLALFRNMSNTRFEEAKRMIRYVSRRGGNMIHSIKVKIPARVKYEMDSLPALGRVLGDCKAVHRHMSALYGNSLCMGSYVGLLSDADCAVDADLARELQSGIGGEVSRVSWLSKRINQLSSMFTSSERPLAEHVFDVQLQRDVRHADVIQHVHARAGSIMTLKYT